MTLVVDASVATLWVLDQDGSDRAAALRAADAMIAPSLVAAEIGSALWKAVRRGDLDMSDAKAALEAALLSYKALFPLEDMRARALEFSVQLDHPIYDCFYLALAEREQAALVTKDERLLRASKRLKDVEVRAL
jgi:predicted nucleic acid-binding protein